jgi:hypothetical protein
VSPVRYELSVYIPEDDILLRGVYFTGSRLETADAQLLTL